MSANWHGWLERLQNIDRRVLYLLLAVLVAFPLLRPFGLPLCQSCRGLSTRRLRL